MNGYLSIGIGANANNNIGISSTDGTSSNNIGLGVQSNYTNNTGNHNIGIGTNANYYSTGSANIGIGTNANMGSGSGGTGNSNIGIGLEAIKSRTSGASNTAIGHAALLDITTGSNNTAIGYFAGRNTVNTATSSNNTMCTFLGYLAGANNTTNYSHSTAVGADVNIDANNQIVLGTIDDKVVIRSINATEALSVVGTIKAGLFNATSDYRLKTNIEPLNNAFIIDNLKPVSYTFKDSNKIDVGFLAHEVQEQFPFLVTGEKDGENMQAINYNGFIGILVKEMQDSKKEIQDLKTELIELKLRLTQIESQM